MSKKVLDQKGRFRNKLISFRMSPEESKMLDRKVALAWYFEARLHYKFNFK